ncbi:cyclic-di-AMP-binding protein CbpB [Streptococcus pluranimalium]|uniref:cyclic-di-AMP-binding protein CbpB n=1 Tax=Streptococcus pluranimalium TaxID=82348 RepID=UPI0039FD6DB1
MIAKAFEDFLLNYTEHYLIPSKDLAIVVDTHNMDHVLLLMTSNGYSRIPVITKEKHYCGTVSISDIMHYQGEHNLADWELSQTDVAVAVNDKVETILLDASLTEIMHKLVDNPFLPVLDKDQHFMGIITRKSILKAVNALLHDFTEDYDIIPKEKHDN